jgi:hypothetical protein
MPTSWQIHGYSDTTPQGAVSGRFIRVWLIALLLNQFQRMSYEPVTSTLIFEGVDAQIISQLF